MTNTLVRRGYALPVVLIFVVLLLSLSSVVYRQIGADMRIESARSAQIVRDQGSLTMMARAMALLTTGTPPSQHYECVLTIETSTGPRGYTASFSTSDGTNWSISTRPTLASENPDPMPATFAP